MHVPRGYTEQEATGIINRVVNKLASNFTFGCHTVDDMKSQGWIFGLEALMNYTYKRPLEEFVFLHIRNQYINFKRKNFKRVEPPCTACPFFERSTGACKAFDDRQDCERWVNWEKRNQRKMSLAANSAAPETPVDTYSTDDTFENVASKELMDLIDEKLDASLRGDYLRMLHKVSIPKNRREKVQQAILEIIKTNGY